MILHSKSFCVYEHVIDDKVFYVGAGTSSRPFLQIGRNHLWMEHVKKSGGTYTVNIVAWFDSMRDALKHESHLINSLRPATNLKIVGFAGQSFVKTKKRVRPPKSLQLSRVYAILEMVKSGKSYRETAAYFGISFQRVHQIVKANHGGN